MPDVQRWRVELAGKDPLKVKPENVRSLLARTDHVVAWDDPVFSEQKPPVLTTRGDGRCLYRCAWRSLNPYTATLDRDELGEPLDKAERDLEVAGADALRLQVVELMKCRRQELRDFLALESMEDVDRYIGMQAKPSTWAGEVELYYMSRVLTKHITVVAMNSRTKRLYLVEYAPQDLNLPEATVLWMFYDGVCHYEVIQQQWLQDTYSQGFGGPCVPGHESMDQTSSQESPDASADTIPGILVPWAPKAEPVPSDSNMKPSDVCSACGARWHWGWVRPCPLDCFHRDGALGRSCAECVVVSREFHRPSQYSNEVVWRFVGCDKPPAADAHDEPRKRKTLEDASSEYCGDDFKKFCRARQLANRVKLMQRHGML
mmetsp:Transcript_124814/g.226532  ORF Transcript_124814/g.226532 Transcript_124814/m.226532 type:complete len:374 (-) Transcript_124814:91-1212(-)